MRRNKTYGCTDRTCGAPDCERCYPGVHSLVECDGCDATCPFSVCEDYIVDTSEGMFCEDCIKGVAEESLKEAHEMLNALGKMCNLDATQQAILDLLCKRVGEKEL